MIITLFIHFVKSVTGGGSFHVNKQTLCSLFLTQTHISEKPNKYSECILDCLHVFPSLRTFFSLYICLCVDEFLASLLISGIT